MGKMSKTEVAQCIAGCCIALLVVIGIVVGVVKGQDVVEIKTETVKEYTKYQVEKREDPNMTSGEIVIQADGVPGEKIKTYNVTYTNGKKTSKELVSEETISEPIKEVQIIGTKKVITWSCVDVTSYNKNAYDDNKCTSNSGEVKYVSDSQAVSLDPDYNPGKSGAYYYNSQ